MKKIQWKKLTLTHKKSQKKIIKDISGTATSGKLFSIMGPSGAGKSSLLSIITRRVNSQYQLEGQITYCGLKYGLKQFSKFSGFVRQDDILFNTLTVQQTLNFQATLKLNYLKQQQRIQLVYNTLIQLNLIQCKNVLVGCSFFKSISGGQKKRLAIGIQLISNPQCLILDQPTSGLDSYNALKIILILKKLCKQKNKLIITTIHQPSSLIFKQIDQLFLLNYGQVIYFGQAIKIVDYMNYLNIKVNSKMNPSDFFMLQISQFYSNNNNYKTPMTADNFIKYQLQSQQKLQQRSMIINQNDIKQKQQSLNWCLQIGPLLNRGIKDFYRQPSKIIRKIVNMIVVPSIIGILYHDVGDKFPQTQDFETIRIYLSQFSSFMFIFIFYNFGMNTYQTVLAIPAQRQIILKQSNSGLYSTTVYFFIKNLIELSWLLIHSLIVSTAIYLTAKLSLGYQHFFLFVAIFILIGTAGLTLGILMGIIFTNMQVAAQITPIFLMPIIIFGGLIVNLKTIPVYVYWVQYLSPVKYAYSAIMIDQLSTDNLHHIWQLESIKILTGLQGELLFNILLLSSFSIVISILSAIILNIKKKAI